MSPRDSSHDLKPDSRHGVYMHPEDGQGIRIMEVSRLIYQSVHDLDHRLDNDKSLSDQEKRDLMVQRGQLIDLTKQLGTLYRAGVTELDMHPGSSIQETIHDNLEANGLNNQFAMYHRKNDLAAPAA